MHYQISITNQTLQTSLRRGNFLPGSISWARRLKNFSKFTFGNLFALNFITRHCWELRKFRLLWWSSQSGCCKAKSAVFCRTTQRMRLRPRFKAKNQIIRLFIKLKSIHITRKIYTECALMLREMGVGSLKCRDMKNAKTRFVKYDPNGEKLREIRACRERLTESLH